MEFLDLLKEYGGYIALPIVINTLMMGLKKGFKKLYAKSWGVRLSYFLPLILGALGGLLLPVEPLQDRILLGSALGAISHYIYKFVTVTLASQTRIKYLMVKRELELGKTAKVEVKDEEKIVESAKEDGAVV